MTRVGAAMSRHEVVSFALAELERVID